MNSAPLDLAAAVRALDAAVAANPAPFDACVRCGLCGTSCHVYLAQPEPLNLPAAKAEAVLRVHRRRHTALGRMLPWLSGARDLRESDIAPLSDAVFGRCTACGRCALHCSIGLDVAAVIRAGRAMVTAAGATPTDLRKTVDNQLDTGNQMAISADELRDTAAWLAEDLQLQTGDPTASIPIDAAGARVLYLVNPREVKFFPLSLQSAAGVFHAAGESWTLSSRSFDVTNYGYFAADDAAARELTERALDEAARLGVSEIVLSECGHGYRAFRWEGPGWTGRPHPVPMRSVLELLDEYLASGRIAVDPSKNAERVTLHDPCNLVRWGGVSEPQRRVLARVVADFAEMTPNRADNWCCGGGGGLLALPEHGSRRVASGALKAEQIRASAAKIVACPCHNCADQLIELDRVYSLGVEIKAVVELVYDALVWPSRA